MKGFLFSFFVLFLVVSPAQAADDSAKQKPSSASKPQEAIKESAHMPPWPYTMPMQKEEREARIDFFLNHMNFQLKTAGAEVGAPLCKDVFARLKENREVKVLEAEHYDAGRVTPLKLCPNLMPNKGEFWFQYNRERPDGRFPILYEATANHEYYDLSAYLGEGVWGFLGEGVTRSCSSGQKKCEKYVKSRTGRDRFTGYERFVGLLGNILNTKTCQKHTFEELGSVYRISVVSSSEYPYDWYAEHPSFTAFVEVSGKLYLVALAYLERWEHFSKLTKSHGWLFFIPVDVAIDPQNKPEDTACLFSTEVSDKE